MQSAEEKKSFVVIAIGVNLEIHHLGELGQLKRPNLVWAVSCLPNVGVSVAASGASHLIGGVSHSVVFMFFLVIGGWVASVSCTSKNLKKCW